MLRIISKVDLFFVSMRYHLWSTESTRQVANSIPGTTFSGRRGNANIFRDARSQCTAITTCNWREFSISATYTQHTAPKVKPNKAIKEHYKTSQ